MKKKHWLLSLISLFCLTGCDTLIIPKDLDITIKVSCDEHCRVVGEPMVKVKKNTMVSFELNFDESYQFLSATNGEYNNGFLMINKSLYSQTVYVSSYLEGDLIISVINDNSLGSIEFTPNKPSYTAGEEITITATPKTERSFTCWTLDNYYHVPYGKEAGTPISFVNSYKFIATGSMTLCANYLMAPNTSWIISYDANDGETIDGNIGFVLDTVNQYNYINPITVTGTWFMHRDGYTLSSYNTKADGSGIRVGIGSKVKRSIFDNKNKLTLYAQWEVWTNHEDFDFFEEEDEVYITKYKKDATIIAIPNYINDKPVTTIKANSFNNLSNLQRVVFNEELLVIEDKAFNSCDNLTTIELYESLNKAFASSFNECDNLVTCYINSNAHALTIGVAWLNLSQQIEYIGSIETELPLMVFCGLSTVQSNNRIDLATNIRAKYRPFIYAAGGSTDMNLIFNLLLSNIRTSDKVIFVSHKHSLGPVVNFRNLAYINNNFDMISEIDFPSIKTQILESFESYSSVVTREPNTPYYSSESGTGFGEFNYTTSEDVTTTADNKSGSKYDMTEYVEDFENYVGDIRETTETHNFPKENVIITTRPWNINNITNMASFDLLDQKYREYFVGFTFVDHLHDNFYSGEYFRLNDDMHLNPFGGYERLKRWDLLLSQI